MLSIEPSASKAIAASGNCSDRRDLAVAEHFGEHLFSHAF